MDQPAQQPAERHLTAEGLHQLYRDYGDKVHAVHELNARLAVVSGELDKAKQLLAELREQYEPKAEEAEAESTEPTSLVARQKG